MENSEPLDAPTGRFARVGVIGCGVMGSGLAEMCAMAELDVTVLVSRLDSVRPRRERLRTSVEKAVRRSGGASADADAAMDRVTFTADIADLADRDLVLEAVAEDEDLKVEVLAMVDKLLGPEAIIATNTSSIPIMKLGAVTSRPGRVLGAHFFNPATRMPLVEVVESLLTDRRCTEQVEAFLTGVLGKEVVRVRDRSGFIVNALLIPYLLSAIRMLESGFASASDIDRSMRLGCHHPMGPLELVDLIGLDVIDAISESLHAEFREPHYSPPPLLRRMVHAGILGRKAGLGFHDYSARSRP